MRRLALVPLLLVAAVPGRALGAEDEAALEAGFREAAPLVKQYCLECHSQKEKQGELDLERFATVAAARRGAAAWRGVVEMLDNGEMPPKEAPQPTADQRRRVVAWARALLEVEIRARAGDPGKVALRRLNNAEYTHTLHDLTGVDLRPAREFPVDSAAGEGFTNTGDALAMSPALAQKYFEAAKEIAAHAVLLPDGARFSRHTSRADQTTELLGRIQAFYANFTEDGGGTAVNLQGVQFNTNQGGRLPLARYLAATLAERDALARGAKKVEDVARERNLSPKYLGLLWKELSSNEPDDGSRLARLRQRWRETKNADPAPLAAEITEAQKSLWKFNSVGHLGRQGGPTRWMEAVGPRAAVVARQEIQWKLPEAPAGGDVVFYLAVGDAGDGAASDLVIWKNLRIEGGGGPPLPLRDVAALARRVAELRRAELRRTAAYLAAAAEVKATEVPAASAIPRDGEAPDKAAAAEALARADAALARAAASRQLDPRALRVWLDYLATGSDGGVKVEGLFTEKTGAGGNKSITGWGASATPLVLANASDQEARIPGLAKPRSVYAHPSPTLFAAIGWRSPIDGEVRVEARVADAHNQCGNGVEWLLRRHAASGVSALARGEIDEGGAVETAPAAIEMRRGQLLSLLIGPRQGNHVCDLTEVQLVITETGGDQRTWDLASDLSPNIQEANPHADARGHPDVWHFFQGEMARVDQGGPLVEGVPRGSTLDAWLAETDAAKRAELAQRVEQIAIGPTLADADAPDALLQSRLRALPTPIDVAAALKDLPPAERFGRHPLGDAVDPLDLAARAPEVIEFRLPAELARGRTLVGAVEMDPQHGRDGAVQAQVAASRLAASTFSANAPILAREDSAARERIAGPIARFANLFPPALCYARIVPVDEVVTLTLYHREDDHLRRLMLDDAQAAALDRLWDEMLFVAQEPLQRAVAFEQIAEFATQDRPDLVKAFAPLRLTVEAAAEAYRQRALAAEPAQVSAVTRLAARAYRRGLTEPEEAALRALYAKLRGEKLSHEEATRLLIARVFTSTPFLYRLERPGPGAEPAAVSDFELASRLSYFLWASLPDEELTRLAAAKQLGAAQAALEQSRRMLRDPRARRLAVEFACQWLHLRDFDQLDEKSERHFPEFAALRGAMYEETILFFEDMFRNDGSILDVLDADHAFVNEALAKHYGLPGVVGPEWRRVDGVKRHGRGGLLGQASALARQSGASRTSPILRGVWISETLLGERLPRPPQDVPRLPDDEAKLEGLTVRQLVERHSSDLACVKCHARVDPYGFSLERFDAIGRLRTRDLGGSPIDARAKLPDGAEIDGLEGLRQYLLGSRRDAFVRQFCRKLLGYALGRSVGLSDEPLLDEMQARLADNGYRFSAAVETIVASKQFRMIRGVQAENEE